MLQWAQCSEWFWRVGKGHVVTLVNPIHSCTCFITCEHVPLAPVVLTAVIAKAGIARKHHTIKMFRLIQIICLLLFLSPKDKERSLSYNKYTFRFKCIEINTSPLSRLEYIIIFTVKLISVGKPSNDFIDFCVKTIQQAGHSVDQHCLLSELK